jgi:murein DD-endopeptidase MepM/ murein hydrolase activator NlpD
MNQKLLLFLLTAVFCIGLLSARAYAVSGANNAEIHQEQFTSSLPSTPVFHYPVVPGVPISGYFDHSQTNGIVTFYNGRHNNQGYGYNFTCSNPYMNDWVGCEDNVAGEPSCSNSRELWYDNHKGIDYEYSTNWHTGSSCNIGQFSGITHPVYTPASGRVVWAGYDPSRPANGWHIRIKHDLNNNGNYDDDNFRSVFLHFVANSLAVVQGDTVSDGQYLGLGGMTGTASTPHLHFEVQRSSDNFQGDIWSVDPYGWSGEGIDPWPYANHSLWKYFVNLPLVIKQEPPCNQGRALISNGNFEQGRVYWIEQGSTVIRMDTPYKHSGSWAAWFGGSNNANDVLYQTFYVPNGTLSASLLYYVWMGTDEPSSTAYSFLRVRLRSVTGSLIRTIDTQTDNSPEGFWLTRSFTISDLGQYAGQTLRLSFEGTIYNLYLTNFYVDDITLTSNCNAVSMNPQTTPDTKKETPQAIGDRSTDDLQAPKPTIMLTPYP